LASTFYPTRLQPKLRNGTNSVLFKPLPYREPDRLLTLYGQNEKYGENWGSSYLDFLDLKRQSKSLEAVHGLTAEARWAMRATANT
jgi:hypothetical protein